VDCIARLFGDFRIGNRQREDAKLLYDEAIAAWDYWHEWREAASLRVNNSSYDEPREGWGGPRKIKACNLIEAAFVAGKQKWVRHLFAIGSMTISTPIELRYWCKLQHRVLEVFPEAFDYVMLNPSFEVDGKTIYPIDEAEKLLKTLISDESEARESAIQKLDQLPELPDVKQQTIDREPKAELCESIVRVAWRYMRALDGYAEPEPVGPFSLVEARSCLDKVLIWTDRADTKPGTAHRPDDEAELDSADDMSHSPDFSTVTWGDRPQFHFNVRQAACICVMWNALESGNPFLSPQYIFDNAADEYQDATSLRPEAVESLKNASRLRDVFKVDKKTVHPAWETMIVKVESGAYGLIRPPTENSHEIPK
jgi:hypothetical protein